MSGGFTPTGNVTFDLFAPTDATCTGTPVFTAADRPLSAGSATSGPFSTTAVGTFHWTATYNGDTNNTAVTSGCTAEPVVITQATPTIATTPSAGGEDGTLHLGHRHAERRFQPDRHGQLRPVRTG